MFAIGVMAAAAGTAAARKISGTMHCEMADFFSDNFALHACFISAKTTTVDGKDVFERIHVATSEAVMMEARELDGNEADFEVEDAPAVAELDSGPAAIQGSFLNADNSSSSSSSSSSDPNNRTAAGEMFAAGRVAELMANSFGISGKTMMLTEPARRSRSRLTRKRRVTNRLFGPQSVLVILVDMEDVHPEYSVDTLKATMSGAGCTEKDCTTPSVEQAFARAGNGEYAHTFPKEKQTVVQISIKKKAGDYDDSYCNYRDVRTDVLAQMAVDFPEIPARNNFGYLVMHVTPGQMTSKCRWGGVAAGRDSWIFSGSSPNLETTVHEMAHNIAIAHAASGNLAIGETHIEYGDSTDVLGQGTANKFNMPHALFAGWIREDAVGWYNKDYEIARIHSDEMKELQNVVDVGSETWTLRPQEERTASDGSVAGVRVRACVPENTGPAQKYTNDGYYYLATSSTFATSGSVAVYFCPSYWGEPDLNQDPSQPQSNHCIKTWILTPSMVEPLSRGYVPHLCANGEEGCGLQFQVDAAQADGRVDVTVNGRCMASPGPDIPNGCTCGGGSVGVVYDGVCKGEATTAYHKVAGGSSCSADKITDTAAGCKAAAAHFGMDFSKTVSSETGRPSGCFWDMNGAVYFNSVLTATDVWVGTGGLCTGTADVFGIDDTTLSYCRLGSHCNVENECEAGEVGEDPCACGNGDCNADGTCECTAGWDGADCTNNIDDCQGQDCGNGECKDGVDTHTCECTAGWDGADCTNNIDDCQGQDCGNGECDTDDGTSCVFPFTYKGFEYSGCSDVGNDGVAWCATTANYDEDKQWGLCSSETCPIQKAKPHATCVTDGTTYRVDVEDDDSVAAGTSCVFPFIYRGIEYQGCTEDYYDGVPWCATTANYDEDEEHRWGVCDQSEAAACPMVEPLDPTCADDAGWQSTVNPGWDCARYTEYLEETADPNACSDSRETGLTTACCACGGGSTGTGPSTCEKTLDLAKLELAAKKEQTAALQQELDELTKAFTEAQSCKAYTSKGRRRM